MILFFKSKPVRLMIRVSVIVIVTFTIGWIVNESVAIADNKAEAPGFGTGMIHGALMPGAMPSLLFGRDIVIYAARNNGRLYKLGYTFGVNACGALFFGAFYWRLNRWRKEYGPSGSSHHRSVARPRPGDA